MEYIVTVEKCTQCGHSHRYSLVEQHVAIRNAAFREGRPRLFSLGPRKPQLAASAKPQLGTSWVTAKCPNTGMPIAVAFYEKDLANKGLDPKRISLALVGPEAE